MLGGYKGGYCAHILAVGLFGQTDQFSPGSETPASIAVTVVYTFYIHTNRKVICRVFDT